MIEDKVELISEDRRSRRRYTFDLPVEYKVMSGRHLFLTGKGKTVDISSKGIAISIDETLAPGITMELAIHWPALLNASCALKLVVTGKVVRSDENITAIRMDRHEFRTRGVQEIQNILQAVSSRSLCCSAPN